MSNKKFILAPSLLACDFSRIGEQLKILEDCGVEYIHLDVMDGMFVPNISFGQPLIKSIRKKSSLIFDTHLMIKDPLRYIDTFVEAGADIITVHVESADNIKETLEYIRKKGVKASVSIKPKTSPEEIRDLLPLCDMVLCMTVEPGFGGQKLIHETLDNIRAVKKMRKEAGLDFLIEADGGIGSENVGLVLEAGAEVIVAGSSVMGKPDIAEAVDLIRNSEVGIRN